MDKIVYAIRDIHRNWQLYLILLAIVILIGLFFTFIFKIFWDCGFSAWILYGERLPWAWLTGYCS